MELEYTTTLPLTDVEVIVVFDYTPYDAGRTSGPLEDCYPPEGGEAEINAVYLPEMDDLLPLLNLPAIKKLTHTCETWARERQSSGEL